MTRNLAIFTENYSAGGVDTVISTTIDGFQVAGDFAKIYLFHNILYPGLGIVGINGNRFTPIAIPGAFQSDLMRRHKSVSALLKVLHPISRYFYVCFNTILFLSYLRKYRVSKVIAHNGGFPANLSCYSICYAAALLNIESVFVCHNLPVKAIFIHRYALFILNILLRRSTKIVCVSQASARSVTSYYPEIGTIHVIPNRVRLPPAGIFIDPPVNGSRVVSCFARLCEEKGIDTLIDAWHELKLSRRDLYKSSKLFLYGTGESYYESYLKERVSSFGLNDSIIFKGFICPPYSDIQESHLVVLPSRSYESMPMILIESLACGRPFISSDVGGVREISSVSNTFCSIINSNSPLLLMSSIIKYLDASDDEYVTICRDAYQYYVENLDSGDMIDSYRILLQT